MFPSPEDIKIIEELVDPLDTIELCATRLCARDVNIAKADRIFEYMIRELRELKSDVGVRLCTEVEYRIYERRLKIPATLMAYLENPMFLIQKTPKKLLTYATKVEIQNEAKDLLLRLFSAENNNDPGSDSDSDIQGSRHMANDFKQYKYLYFSQLNSVVQSC